MISSRSPPDNSRHPTKGSRRGTTSVDRASEAARTGGHVATTIRDRSRRAYAATAAYGAAYRTGRRSGHIRHDVAGAPRAHVFTRSAAVNFCACRSPDRPRRSCRSHCGADRRVRVVRGSRLDVDRPDRRGRVERARGGRRSLHSPRFRPTTTAPMALKIGTDARNGTGFRGASRC